MTTTPDSKIVTVLAKDGLVSDVSFCFPLESGLFGAQGKVGARTSSDAWSAQHETIAEQLSSVPLASVLIDREHLDDSLYDDPKHMRKTTHILCSPVIEAIRRHKINQYMSLEEVDRFIDECGLETRANNWSDESLRFKLQDAVFAAEELALLPEYLERERESFTWDYDPETDEEKPRENWEELWPRERLRLLMPRTEVRCERQYHMPQPFHWWDSRNQFQQWFFGLVGDKVFYERGGSASSGSRLYQGLFAHAFAMLAHGGKSIPTFWLRYDRFNQLRPVDAFEGFRTVRHELSGNYHVDLRGTQHLFEGRLVDLPGR